ARSRTPPVCGGNILSEPYAAGRGGHPPEPLAPGGISSAPGPPTGGIPSPRTPLTGGRSHLAGGQATRVLTAEVSSVIAFLASAKYMLVLGSKYSSFSRPA